METQNKAALAAIACLIILQSVMLVALFAKSSPHPPNAIPFFAIAPFLGVSLAVAASSIIMNTAGRTGASLAVLSAILALLSFGPHKYIDTQFPLIWPAVIAGQVAALVIFYQAQRVFAAPSKTSQAS